MTATLTDLTLAQLTTAYGTLAGIEVKPRTFNGKAKALARLTALLAEKGLTTADAMSAAGIETSEPAAPASAPCSVLDEIEDDGYGVEVELVEDGDVPGTEDPPEDGMVWDGDAWIWPVTTATDQAADTGPVGADQPTGDDTSAIRKDANCSAPDAPTGAPGIASEDRPAPALTGPDRMPVFVGYGSGRPAAIKGFREALVDAGFDEAHALVAAKWLDGIIGRNINPPQKDRPETREGSKQQLLIEMLRRPEGATIAQIVVATGWQKHTVRGAIAGALKKKLGLDVTSTKADGADRVYRIAQ